MNINIKNCKSDTSLKISGITLKAIMILRQKILAWNTNCESILFVARTTTIGKLEKLGFGRKFFDHWFPTDMLISPEYYQENLFSQDSIYLIPRNQFRNSIIAIIEFD